MDQNDSPAPVRAIVIRRLREAWLDMSNFGNHDGACDNTKTCKHCGSRLSGCSLHQASVQRRMAAMSDAIADVVREYGDDGERCASVAGLAGLNFLACNPVNCTHLLGGRDV